jgi:GT2 family glycosyltransferase
MNQPFNPLESNTVKPTLSIDLHDGSTEQTSIIVVHHDRPEFLNICLQSVHTMSNLNNYEIIVVDNNSGQTTQEYLDVLEEEGIKVVRNKKNEYWSKACNMGVAAADPNSKYYVFLHADTVILNPAWLDILVNISVAKNSGLVGCQFGSYWLQKQKVDFVQEWCVLITKECWGDIGPWPEELPLVGMSFIMTLTAQYKGYNPMATGNPIVHHYKSFCMDPNEYERMCEEAMGIIGRLAQNAQSPSKLGVL